MDYKLRRLDRTLASPGKVLEFYRDRVQLPDGQQENWDFVHHKRGGGACVVPVLPDGRILLIHQYRPAVDRETTELPAGAFDMDDPDFSITASEKVEVYLAEDLTKSGSQNLDEAEEIGLEAIPVEELKRRIFAGEIRDAKTVAGILAYLAVLSDRGE